MTRITPDHLARGAFIYIRQSTSDQVLHNHESRRRQYGLVDRARALGWGAIEVIDDDLGRSGSGISRPGFEKLLAAICEGRVGAVVSIEASRLARNGRDWHTLLEFCGLVGTLIIDEDGVYDPRHPNDRLLLGMKGTMSEMELSLFRQRSLEALKQKARRGELFLTVAIGYVKTSHDRIEKDPDRRVQQAIMLAFNKFAELQTVRQVHLWMRQQRLPLPATEYGPEGRRIVWKLPVYNTLHHLLTNPIYAGAYVFGRTGSRITIEAGRKRIVRGFRKERSSWEVLIPDHHEGYIRAIFASVWKRVTAMVEPAACVGGGDAVEGGGESGFEHVGGARFSSAQGALGLGPAGFDRRQVGRVARQIKEREPGFGESGLDRLRLVCGQIVHQHRGARMAAAQLGDQHGL